MSKKTAETSDGEHESGLLNEEYIDRLRVLTEVLESGDENRVQELVGELTTLRESELYLELGRLTREIHDSINKFGNDERIAELANEAIPDAKERLNFIVTKTDEAAHKTMEEAEATMGMVDNISDGASGLHNRWQQFRNRELTREEFIGLSKEVGDYLELVDTKTNLINSKMTDIMLAQDYQDITGQMIKQVVTMVQEVEEKLVRLVTISGATVQEVPVDAKSGEIAEGPQLPTADSDKVASSQGDVDDLLASLGF